MNYYPGGGGGGHVSLGPVHHPCKSLSEKHPKRGWSDDTHSSLNSTPWVSNGVSLPNFLPFPIISGLVRDLRNWYPFFPYFPVFDTLNAIRALRAWWRKRYPFLRVFIYADDIQAPMRHAPPPPRDYYPLTYIVINVCCHVFGMDLTSLC